MIAQPESLNRSCHPDCMDISPLPTPLDPATRQVRRRVAINQALFTAGYTLTSGGFLYYFVSDTKASPLLITILLALPELIGVLAIASPWALKLTRNRKRLFVISSLLARFVTCLIPILLVIPHRYALFTITSALALQGILQAIAFTAYLSWMSDLAPETAWGRVFGRRDLVKAGVMICVPLLAALLKRNLAASEIQTRLTIIIFLSGNFLQLLSLLPLLKLPAVEPAEDRSESVNQSHGPAAARGMNREFLILLGFSFTLAIVQGITQTPFFLHTYKTLKLDLLTYYSLTGSMYLVQMLTAHLAGNWGDRIGYRNQLMLGTWITSGALVFWILSLSHGWNWLIPAYLLWGAFGMVNLALQNLTLEIIPRTGNTWHIALCRQGSGFLAGLLGILGGVWLEKQLGTNPFTSQTALDLTPFYWLFTISLMGRILAPLWLLGLPSSR